MKKIALFVMALMMTVAAHAQFEQGKFYMGASLSGLDFSYNGNQKGKFAFQSRVGYLVLDDVMFTAQLGYEKQNSLPHQLQAGIGARYYIEQNGLYLGASAIYKHNGDYYKYANGSNQHFSGYKDLLPSVQVGYAFFVSRTVTIEPELYYEQSFKNHSDYSTVGFRLGVGVYLFKDKTQN